MKFKSKLIATIVSICTAIAVMGIGVWAAVSTFTTSISNTVSLFFDNLAGEIWVSAETGVDNLKNGGSTPSLPETMLYSQGKTIYNKIAAEEDDLTLEWEGTMFLDSTKNGMKIVDQSTKAAAVAYLFIYQPHADNVGVSNIAVQVTETSTPVITGGTVQTAYFVSTDNITWTEITSGVSMCPACDNENLFVLAVCQYHNPEQTSVTTVESNWDFDVTFTATSDTERTKLIDGERLPERITDGVFLPLDYTSGSGSGSGGGSGNDYTDVPLDTTAYQKVNAGWQYSPDDGLYGTAMNFTYTPEEITGLTLAANEHVAMVLDIRRVLETPVMTRSMNGMEFYESVLGHYDSFFDVVYDLEQGTAIYNPVGIPIDSGDPDVLTYALVLELIDENYLVNGKYNFSLALTSAVEPAYLECLARYVIINEELEIRSALSTTPDVVVKSFAGSNQGTTAGSNYKDVVLHPTTSQQIQVESELIEGAMSPVMLYNVSYTPNGTENSNKQLAIDISVHSGGRALVADSEFGIGAAINGTFYTFTELINAIESGVELEMVGMEQTIINNSKTLRVIIDTESLSPEYLDNGKLNICFQMVIGQYVETEIDYIECTAKYVTSTGGVINSETGAIAKTLK